MLGDSGNIEEAVSGPSHGLARGIRSLFEGREKEASPVQSFSGDLSLVSGGEPEGDREADAQSGSGARSRLTTRLATFLRTPPESRSKLVPGILEDAALLRKRGDLPPIIAAITALLSAPTEDETGTAFTGLATELMDREVANYVALAIGAEREAGARDPLIAIARAFPVVVAPAAAELLAESSDRGARRALMDLLINLDSEGRSAMQALLRDPRWYAVRNGVHLLAELGDEGAVQGLTIPLAHADPRVRRETVIALAKIGGDDAGLLLVGMLSDPNADVRAAAAMGVGALRVLRALRPLLEMIATEQEEEVQVQILLALGQIGDPGAVPAIEKKAVGTIFGRPPRPLRLAAYRALAAIGTPHARSVVEAAATDKDAEVRQAVDGILRGVAKSAGGKEPLTR